MGLNINSLNWKQIFNDHTGKTTGLLTFGNLGAAVGLGGILVSGNTIAVLSIYAAFTGAAADAQVISFMSTLLNTTFGLFSLSALMLGLDRGVKDKVIPESVETEKPKKEEAV